MRSKTKKTQLDDAEFERQVKKLLEDFALDARGPTRARKGRARPRRSKLPPRRLTLDEATREFQRKFVLAALEEHQIAGRWNIRATARALDVTPYRLYRLIQRLGLPHRTMRDLQRADAVCARPGEQAVMLSAGVEEHALTTAAGVEERDASTVATGDSMLVEEADPAVVDAAQPVAVADGDTIAMGG